MTKPQASGTKHIVDHIVNHSVHLLNSAVALARSGRVPAPSADQTSALCKIADELHRAALTPETVVASKGSVDAKQPSDSIERLPLAEEIERFVGSVNEQLSSWKHEASAARAEITELRRVASVETDAMQIAKKALDYCMAELLSCCNNVSEPSANSAETGTVQKETELIDTDDDQDLRNPISASDSISEFPFQHLQATDISTMKPGGKL